MWHVVPACMQWQHDYVLTMATERLSHWSSINNSQAQMAIHVPFTKPFISTKLVGDRGTMFANWCVLPAKDAWGNSKRSGYKIDGGLGTLWMPHCSAIYIVFSTEQLVAPPRFLNTTMWACALLHAPMLLLFFIFNNLPQLSIFRTEGRFCGLWAWDNEDTQHGGFTMNVCLNKYNIYAGNIAKCACSETAWFIQLRWIIPTKKRHIRYSSIRVLRLAFISSEKAKHVLNALPSSQSYVDGSILPRSVSRFTTLHCVAI